MVSYGSAFPRARQAIAVACALLAMAARGAAGGPPEATVTPTATPVPCTGNCDGGPAVSVDELVRGVGIALDQLPFALCPAFDASGDQRVSVDELVQGVNNALNGCGVAPPSRTPTRPPTASPSHTPLPPTPTATASPSATRTSTRTPTRTVTPAVSVCGGAITSAPKLCDVEVVPNPVPLFGLYRLDYCLSDREGDVSQACYGVRTGPDPPLETCEAVVSTARPLNGCFASGAIRSTNPAGNYSIILYFRDRAGNRSNVVEAAFRIAP